MTQYILNGHEPIPCKDTIEWTMWLKKADRCVGDDEQDGVRVSTDFLGFDRNWLFETLIFGGKHDGGLERYSTWEEAETGHRKMCAIAFGKD